MIFCWIDLWSGLFKSSVCNKLLLFWLFLDNYWFIPYNYLFFNNISFISSVDGYFLFSDPGVVIADGASTFTIDSTYIFF